ncbi:MFS transporter [Faecalicatena contorta]|uniref:Predicted arabinose efflux permease, MFS family n=1 Tax=Faecalicatena contorta TaxID=39482 RepID=A0A315ZP58_9FIRM|nr:MFS transporter [Faecalicatena contorta]PWJ47092.1 putative MFS family arabinose efflux permease [Faecalicatena contorta]SUQ16193.1 Predicted arabinose efflux permease, MFS family [Faecalicatena contorta]
MENKKQSLWTKDFIAITVINLLLFCGFQMLLPTLPLFAKSLGGSDTALGWIVGSATIASLIIRPVAGVILDKIGRKGILTAGVFIMILVTLVFGWLPSVGAIIAVRFMHGIGWGMASTASSTIASDKIPKSRFGEGMGYFSLSSSLAMALAPGIALGIFAAHGFKTLTFWSAGLSAAVLLLSFFIRNTQKPELEETKMKAAIYEKTSILPSVIMFLVCVTYGSITGFLSIYAAEAGIQNIGVFFSVYAVTLLVSRPLSGKLTDRFGFSSVIYPGLLFLAGAMVLLSRAASLPAFLVCAAVYGLGLGSVQSSLQAMAIVRAPKERRGAANATFFTGFDGGIGFGSVIGGMIASLAGYSGMYLYLSLFVIFAGILYYLLFTKKRKLDNTGNSLK